MPLNIVNLPFSGVIQLDSYKNSFSIETLVSITEGWGGIPPSPRSP